LFDDDLHEILIRICIHNTKVGIHFAFMTLNSLLDCFLPLLGTWDDSMIEKDSLLVLRDKLYSDFGAVVYLSDHIEGVDEVLQRQTI